MRVFVWRGKPDLSFIDVRPGDWVVLKPNLIKECKENDPTHWESVITSPDLIEAVARHVADALAGQGRITICDAPQTDSSFARIAERLGLARIAESVRRDHGVDVEVLDLRKQEWTNRDGIIVDRRELPGDPEGNLVFDLGRDSLFYRHPGEGRFYGADYDHEVVNRHHHGVTQEYLVCATPIRADVFINLPKMKTHKKTGVTLSLKNLVGINADKNWLPHHTEGAPSDGGDQFPDLTLERRLERSAVRMTRQLARKMPGVGTALARRLRAAGTAAFGSTDRVIRSGNWHGNDTTWRMALDLNRCLLYGKPDGSLSSTRDKRYYTVLDGRIGMQGSGPMQGDPVASDVVLGGTDPVAVDAVAARIMGFDWRKIPIIREAFHLERRPIAGCAAKDIVVDGDVPEWCGRLVDIEERDFLSFEPHFGWKGSIEWDA